MSKKIISVILSIMLVCAIGAFSVAAEAGACAGKKDIATKAKQLGLDAIHDTVHEMAKDEARHGCAFQGLLNRYFGK